MDNSHFYSSTTLGTFYNTDYNAEYSLNHMNSSSTLQGENG